MKQQYTNENITPQNTHTKQTINKTKLKNKEKRKQKKKKKKKKENTVVYMLQLICIIR